MIRRSFASVVAALVVLAFASVRADEAPEKRFTFLYTTDIHAHYLGKDDGKGHKVGGMAAIAAKVKEIRDAAKDPVFVFDSGDMMTGTPASDLERQGVVGGPLYEMMNVIGYDAWCIGNHDFDKGRANVTKIVEMLKFPTLSTNLVVEGEPAIAFTRWKVIEKGGVRVGVFGLMSEHFAEVTGRDKVQGIHVTKCVDAVKEAVAALTSKCDVIVALSHCGSDDDVKLSDQVSGIDVILSGHNHRPLKPAFHGHTVIAEGAHSAERLGRIDFRINREGHLHFDSSALLTLEPAEATGELKKLLDEVHESVGKRLEEPLAKLIEPWKRDNKGESNIGNFFADGLKAHAHADCAFLNSGGIRANHEGAEITVGDVLEIFPFENAIVAFDVSGADLKKICEKNAHAMLNDEYGILQVAGVRFEFTRNGKVPTVTKVTVNGEPLDPNKKYRCAAIDFIAVDQHEKYFGTDVKVENLEKLSTLMSKVAEDWVREEGKKGPIHATVDGRQVEKD